jgi:hypothetical protein
MSGSVIDIRTSSLESFQVAGRLQLRKIFASDYF